MENRCNASLSLAQERKDSAPTPDGVRTTATSDQSPALPYPPSSLIERIELDFSTHRRSAVGSDNFQLTWADDDHLYGDWGDGGGFGGTNNRGRVGLGVARIEGMANDYRGINVWGGYAARHPATFDGKSWGMICIDGTLFMWVVPDVPEGKTYRNHYEYCELASSADHGATWRKAPWWFHQREGLTVPTFLNFARDGDGVPSQWSDYVYSYFIRPQQPEMEQQGPRGVGLIVHKPGAIYLARAKSNELLAGRKHYEFFAGVGSAGAARWGDLKRKQPVFEDPGGVGWCMSASYNPFLERVLLITEHGSSRQAALGIFDAPTPWGPWMTVKYHTASEPFGSKRTGSDLPWNNNVFFAAFITKWFDDDSFVLNFTGAGRGRDNDSFNTVHGRFVQRNKSATRR